MEKHGNTLKKSMKCYILHRLNERFPNIPLQREWERRVQLGKCKNRTLTLLWKRFRFRLFATRKYISKRSLRIEENEKARIGRKTCGFAPFKFVVHTWLVAIYQPPTFWGFEQSACGRLVINIEQLSFAFLYHIYINGRAKNTKTQIIMNRNW